MIYGEETYKESGQIFWDAPEEERLRNVPASMLKTAICLSGGQGGPSASAQGFPCLRSFTDGHQVKEKGKNPLCFESYLHAAAAGERVSAGFIITTATARTCLCCRIKKTHCPL